MLVWVSSRRLAASSTLSSELESALAAPPSRRVRVVWRALDGRRINLNGATYMVGGGAAAVVR